MSNSINKLSVVIPIYGSEKIIENLYSQLVEVLEKDFENFEIIFVEDVGPDNVWQKMKKLAKNDDRVVAIQLMKNSGQGAATLCGIQHSTGDVIITMDDDLQHPPTEIKKLTDFLLKNEKLDVVIGAPIEKKHNFIRRAGSDFINRLNSVFLDKDVNLKLTSFRAMRRDVALEITKIQTPYPVLGPLIIQVTRRIANVPFAHESRKSGKSNYSITKIIKQTLSNLIGYSMIPLRMMAVMGGIGIMLSFVIGIYYLSRYFIIGIKITGWMSLMLILVSISGFIFFAFAIIGEYVLRIMQITSANPQFLVRNKVTKEQ